MHWKRFFYCPETGGFWLFLLTLVFYFAAGYSLAQNPPLTGDPYAPRGAARSPDGSYEWIVKLTPTVRYELTYILTGKVIAAVDSYYPIPDKINIRYGKALGVYWNRDSSLVALDELNRRRAGRLYLFALARSEKGEQKAALFIPTLKTNADEARLVVDPGWISNTRIRVRLAERSDPNNTDNKFYYLDFSNPKTPQVKTTNAFGP